MMANEQQRPSVTVQGKATSSIELPAVFKAPIRVDVVHHVHRDLNKNHRQAYGVSRLAGAQTSAESWGTGRAVARIPRVGGGGTHRSGQGAFGNMCRGGRMFAPTKVWRRWHRRVNRNQRRFAVASALAASAVPSLVLARGHKIQNLPEVPLVVADADLAAVTKTKQALALFATLGAHTDIEHSKNSRSIRAGSGKSRNRRFVQRRGPLVVINGEKNLAHAVRNLAGVEVINVHKLNLLQLAPGGHVGRFIIWTESAFKQLDTIFGKPGQAAKKSGFVLPRAVVTNADIDRIIKAPEVVSRLRPVIKATSHHGVKQNPLKNNKALFKLNPYAASLKRRAIKEHAHNVARRAEIAQQRRDGKLPAGYVAGHKKMAAEAKAAKKSHAQWYKTIFA